MRAADAASEFPILRGGARNDIATPPRTRFFPRRILDLRPAAEVDEMKRLTLSLIAFACAIAAPHVRAAESACPRDARRRTEGVGTGADWTVTYSGYQTAVAGVTIFDGPPSEQASLVPDNEKNDRRQPSSRPGSWRRAIAATGCSATMRIPPRRFTADCRRDVTRCDVTYERNVRFGGGSRVVKSVNCK